MTGARLILFVNDDPGIREAFQCALEDAAYQIVVACNGKEALQILRCGPEPALILLDLMMPVMGGAEFVECQSQDPRLAHIPVVILTAGDLREERAPIRAAGYADLPMSLDTLLAIAAWFAA